MLRSCSQTHIARMAHNGHCDESISIDVLDREIVAKWQYTFVRFVRWSSVCFIWSFVLTDGRFLPNGFLYFDSSLFSARRHCHRFIHFFVRFGSSSFILLRFFSPLPSWRRGNSRCVRFSLMITRSSVHICCSKRSSPFHSFLHTDADVSCNHSPVPCVHCHYLHRIVSKRFATRFRRTDNFSCRIYWKGVRNDGCTTQSTVHSTHTQHSIACGNSILNWTHSFCLMFAR